MPNHMDFFPERPDTPSSPDQPGGDLLARMFYLQNEAQQVFYAGSWPTADDITRMERIRTAALSLFVEVAEGLGETGWKPWATSNHLNREAFRGEMVDVLKFWMNLCLNAGITPQEIFDGFVSKHYTNMERQRVGYDGVSTKCPGCKRAYDDPATRCRPMTGDPEIDGLYARCDILGLLTKEQTEV